MVTIKIFPIIFGILIFAAIFGIVLNYKFLSLLKERHFEKWKELGSPSLAMNNSAGNNLAVLKFLKNREYIKLSDTKLTKIAQVLWNYGMLYLVFFVGAIILFAIIIGK